MKKFVFPVASRATGRLQIMPSGSGDDWECQNTLLTLPSKSFVDSKFCDQQRPLSPAEETDDTVRVVVPFKDQISPDIVKEKLKDLSLKVNTTIQSVFPSRKIEQELNVKETKPPIVNEECVVYNF